MCCIHGTIQIWHFFPIYVLWSRHCSQKSQIFRRFSRSSKLPDYSRIPAAVDILFKVICCRAKRGQKFLQIFSNKLQRQNVDFRRIFFCSKLEKFEDKFSGLFRTGATLYGEPSRSLFNPGGGGVGEILPVSITRVLWGNMKVSHPHSRFYFHVRLVNLSSRTRHQGWTRLTCTWCSSICPDSLIWWRRDMSGRIGGRPFRSGAGWSQRCPPALSAKSIGGRMKEHLRQYS